MSETWPSFLPCLLLDSYSYKRRSLVVRSDMEDQHMRIRQRFGDGPTAINAAMLCSRPQLAYFEGYWIHRLKAGAVSAVIPIMIGQGDAIPHECKFTDEYSVTPLGGGRSRVELALLATKIDVFDADTLEAIEAYAGDIAVYSDFLAELEIFVNTFLPTVLG